MEPTCFRSLVSGAPVRGTAKEALELKLPSSVGDGPYVEGHAMSDCLHCDINELVAKHAEQPDADASELVARMAESLVDLILMAPETDRSVLLAEAITMLGQMYLEKSGAIEPGESTARH
jgi:hypothetical protein